MGLYHRQDTRQYFVPLRAVDINAEIEGSFSKIKIDLIYQNPNDVDMTECIYTFPLSKKIIMSNMLFRFEDKVIHTKIMEKT
jgi:hypothetical protein